MELPDVTIQAFPSGDAYWRIDWFGEVALPNRLLRRQQPSVLVYLSRVVADDFLANPAVLLQAGSTAPAMFQRKCWVSVGTMVLLRVGDIWRDQRPVFTPDYQLESFELDIDEDSSFLAKVGVSRDDGFLLPLDHHPWHLQNTHAYCQAVALPDGRQVVIPCMELIRFYFGSSSSLLSRLFQPPLTRDRLVAESGFDISRRHLHLTLAEGMPAASAADIGRIASSRQAWWAALEVGTSCLQALAAGAPHGIHPKAKFPFGGMTTITAAGKWLPLGERAQATFLVFSLRQCQRAFRFKSLEYRHSGPMRARRPVVAAETIKPLQSQARRQAGDAPHQPLVERDAGHQLSPTQKSMRLAQRFTDLVNKPIWGSRKVVAGETRAAPNGQVDPVQAGALGKPGSGERIRPMELAQAMAEEERPETPAFLALVVERLSALPDAEVRLLTASEADGWTMPISLAFDEDGVIDPALFLHEAGTPPRLRRVAVFALIQAPSSSVVAVVEAEPFVAMRYPGAVHSVPEAASDRWLRVSHDFAAMLRREPADVDDSLGRFPFATCDAGLRDLLAL